MRSAHPKRIGDPLREDGHDVRALATDSELDGIDDEAVLELAASEGRILVTRNSRDFAPLCRSWAEAGRDHAGVILIWTLSARQFGEIVAGIRSWLEQISDEADWRSVVVPL